VAYTLSDKMKIIDLGWPVPSAILATAGLVFILFYGVTVEDLKQRIVDATKWLLTLWAKFRLF